jgi:hypothetical protein
MFFIPKSIALLCGAGECWKPKSLIALTRAAGPYLAMALLLPGGSVIALLAWLYRRRTSTAHAMATPQLTRRDGAADTLVSHQRPIIERRINGPT